MNLKEMLFWSEKDVLDRDELSSKDPLGTEAFAGDLADLLLPGLTTLTRRIRYVTLVCLWLDVIDKDKEYRCDTWSDVFYRVKNLEKLSAYCICRAFGSPFDAGKMTGLIGQQYAMVYIDGKPKTFRLDNYPFLMNHGASGALPSYKVLLKALGYVETDGDLEVCLTPAGRDLIDGLKIPCDSLVTNIILRGVTNTDTRSKEFVKLGRFFDLSNFAASEKTKLRRDLIAEGSPRKTTFKLLRNYARNKKLGEFDIITAISQLRGDNVSDKRIKRVCEYIIRFEKPNREAHYVFYSLMRNAAHRVSLNDVLKEPDVRQSIDILKETSAAYIRFHSENGDSFAGSAFPLFIKINDCLGDRRKIVKAVVAHHLDNQRRKQKAPWLEEVNDMFTVILHRYRKDEKDMRAMKKGAIHQYRIENAKWMIDDLAL